MEILKLREHSELASEAAAWFHSKWDIPVEEYAGSIQECLTGKSIVPQWYVAVENQQIIGGIGVIENDFHNRMFVRICVHLAWKPYISLQTTQASMSATDGSSCVWRRAMVR